VSAPGGSDREVAAGRWAGQGVGSGPTGHERRAGCFSFGPPRVEPWRLVADQGAVPFRLPGPVAAVRDLPAGTQVVLLDGRPGARWRCWRFAAAAGVRVEAAYVALPSLRRPLYLVRDSPETLRYFWSDLLVLPLAPPALPLAGLALALLRRAGALRWTGLAAPGFVAVGRRR
jgi:hypothetical protein